MSSIVLDAISGVEKLTDIHATIYRPTSTNAPSLVDCGMCFVRVYVRHMPCQLPAGPLDCPYPLPAGFLTPDMPSKNDAGYGILGYPRNVKIDDKLCNHLPDFGNFEPLISDRSDTEIYF